MKRFVALGVALCALLLVPTSASAAPPDGAGPWADSVTSTDQKLRKNGTSVLASRSNPTSALGIAEDTNAEGTFYSLGFGGSVALGFDNNICNAPGPDVSIELHETTREPYPNELVDVYVSSDGSSWVLAASNVNKDSQVSLPDSVNVARYVKLVDVSDPNVFSDGIADGYDVDGVKALNTNCSAKGKMVGAATSQDGKVTHGFLLRCDRSGKLNSVVVTWKEGKKTNLFVLKTLDSALCSDDPTISEQPPVAGFDTFQGRGTGGLNGKSGYKIDFTFTDAGEPGAGKDSARILIKDSLGNVVLDYGPAKIKCGEHQAFATS